MAENIKTQQHAMEVVVKLQEEYSEDAIKDFEIPTLFNVNTGKESGYAVILHLNNKYSYTDAVLKDIKKQLGAESYLVRIRNRQLQIQFTIHYFMPSEQHIAKMSHAIGLDHKHPDKSGLYEAYRNGSWYEESDDLWVDLVRHGYAEAQVIGNESYSYFVTQKGFQFLADHYKIMIRYENEYEGRTE